MFVLGINQFIKNIRKSIIPIFQVMVLFITGALLISVYSEQSRVYKGLKGKIDSTSWVIQAGFMPREIETLKGVDSVLGLKTTESNNNTVSIISYDTREITYMPRLIRGKGFDKTKGTDGVIRAFVSDKSPWNNQIGEKIEVGGRIFKIQGVFSSDELLFGLEGLLKLDGTENYLNCFSTEDEHKKHIILAEYGDFEREIGEEWYYTGKIIVDCRDDISDEDLEFNKTEFEKSGIQENVNMIGGKEVYDNSKEMINAKLGPLYVIFALALMYSLISLIVDGTLTVQYEKRNYAIYFITGNSWKNTVFVGLVHRGIEILISFLGFILLLLPVKRMVSSLGYEIILNKVVIVSLILIAFFILIITTLVPFLILKKIKPVTLFRNNEV